jgi:hypothetical protein
MWVANYSLATNPHFLRTLTLCLEGCSLLLPVSFCFFPPYAIRFDILAMAKKGSDGAYFFDRDSEIFGFIMNFYRTGKMIIPKNMPIKSVKEELDYFGINLDEDGTLYVLKKEMK